MVQRLSAPYLHPCGVSNRKTRIAVANELKGRIFRFAHLKVVNPANCIVVWVAQPVWIYLTIMVY